MNPERWSVKFITTMPPLEVARQLTLIGTVHPLCLNSIHETQSVQSLSESNLQSGSSRLGYPQEASS